MFRTSRPAPAEMSGFESSFHFVDSLADGNIEERTAGPQSGYFFAVYACPLADGFLGYFKICRDAPPNYWEAKCVLKGAGSRMCTTPNEAMDDALKKAIANLGMLPSRPSKGLTTSTLPGIRS